MTMTSSNPPAIPARRLPVGSSVVIVTSDPVVTSSPETEEMSFKSAKSSPGDIKSENFPPPDGVSPDVSIGWLKSGNLLHVNEF